MGKLIVQEWMSFDGVVQAPSEPGEDTSGGFRHGGWHGRYFDDRSMHWVVDNLTAVAGYVLGRRTYEAFAAHWPKASPEEAPLAEQLNGKPKYVVTATLSGPLAWEKSKVLTGPVRVSLPKLKEEVDGDLLVIGSATLVQSLIHEGLVDELRLMIDPVVVGGGKRVLPDDGEFRPLHLTKHEVTSTGAVLATYTM